MVKVGRVVAGAVLGAAVSLLVWQTARGEPSETSARAGLEAARRHGPLAVPEQLPPRLEDAWFSSTPATRSASFYSLDAPVVTVCTGERAACLSTSRDTPIRVSRLGELDVVVSVSPAEEGASPRPLPAELGRYWDSTVLTMAAPDWRG